MAKNRLVITHENNTIRLSWQRGQENPRFADAVPFQHPFDEEALTDLRWYLEEYLRFPYGIFPDKAEKIIEPKLQQWGEQLFSLVFRSSEKARQFFQAATYDGLNQCQLSITSDDPTVLSLPWELLYSPDDRKFLAPSLAQMYRSLSDYKVRAEMGEMQQEKLNILLVIARPHGEKDIGFQTIARPMLAALKPIRQQVNLKVLRPPSFQEFERELNNNKSFYHIVHFDGHGEFDPNSVGFQHSFGGAGQGLLVFENPDGSPQYITAAQIAQSLTDCGVPIFVLNACKSAQEGSEPFSSVATRLVAEGAKGVVAMAYSVYAVGARHFIGRFYEQLVRGKSLAEAMAAGRLEMLNQRLRPSPKGDLPLQDWLVPVLYQQQSYQPFTVSNSDTVPDIDDLLEPTTKLIEIPDEGAYGFVGRDYDILRLERAFRQNQIVMLQGMAGVGKTELVCGFARWLEETQGRAGLIFFTSFERGAGEGAVVNQVGRAVWGDKFSQYPTEKQRIAVLQYLKTQPCLLIWDNFEPVAGFPTGNEPLLPADERDNLQRFLKKLRGGKSWVLITSRREERWLDCGYTLLNLKGLDEKDAEEFAAKVLRTVGVDRANLPKEYLELLKLLGGHPLSLRVVLPHLKTQSPVQLIEDLQRGGDRFKGVEEEGRDKSLTVSLDYSFARLSEKCRRHLPFLGLFSERVVADWLHSFSSNPDDGDGQAYKAVFGENLQESDWLRILNEAAEAGVLEHWGGTIYKIHPALPWYLRQRLSEQQVAEKVSEIEKKLLIFYADLAETLRQLLITNARTASSILEFEEPNLLKSLRLAEHHQSWENAQLILQALGDIYRRIGHQVEFKALRQRLLKHIGIHLVEAKAKGKDACDLWVYLRGLDANEAAQSRNLEQAGAVYQEILDELTALNDPSLNDNIASMYLNLGNVAQMQRQSEQAITFYRKAIQIHKDAENDYKVAGAYHNMGIIAQEQRQLEQAKYYFQKALKIRQNLGDDYNAASDYDGLGLIAYQQGYFQEAIAYFYEALQIYQNAGDDYQTATICSQLGAIFQEQGHFGQARTYLHQAIQIYEDAGDNYNAAGNYHNLGIIAQQEQMFEDALAYHKKSLKIFENFKDWHKAGLASKSLCNVLIIQKNWIEALQMGIKILAIDIEHNQDLIDSDIKVLGLMLKQLGESEFEAIWCEVTDGKCAGDVRTAIWAARDNLETE